MNGWEIIQTGDGSATLYNNNIKEYYHSYKGAISESEHVFLKEGLLASSFEKIKLLELGFGTGLNALLTLKASQFFNKPIYYTTLESNPLDISVINKLNYTELTGLTPFSEDFKTMHQSSDGETINIGANFFFTKITDSFLTHIFTCTFNLIYYDAFAPRIQPELWNENAFEKLYSILETNGSMVTYCAKGEVKRTLKKCGFEVLTLPGPPGKREMIKAIKKQ